MVEALIAGERDPGRLADLSKSRMRAKKDQLVEALAGRFAALHGLVAREILDHIAFLDAAIARLTAEIVERTGPFEAAITLLCGISGWGRKTAEVFIAETGGDMSIFPTPGQLAASGEPRVRWQTARSGRESRKPLAGSGADRVGASR